ncbi:cobalt-precorrin 4 C11-methyltransferase [Natranaerovirga hydrolytica]|uniref:Cobalt-precorrin 4 C11-methyltransferase n=1 Tax=Natranaerovirga hydrolytica TaxID=680378 RepID=A0A4R1MZN9_9FIRM|nr:precorrin-4 C(11)-methyltransferase [Natranaerovirga hydrolytica]TCK98655.1 cobalt-precorrin 4 C11-methyltransferase [Natranaerovirga hydrolytica]
MVIFVGAGPGDVELITIKGMKALEKADCVIYAGSLVNEKLLAYCQKDVITYNSAQMTLDEVIEVMHQMHQKGKKVVRLHTGDPSIYGAIKEQMDRLKTYNIPYKIIPGVSSFLGAAAAIKEELTLPGVSQTVIITRRSGRTGHNEGGSLKDLAKHQATMSIFLSVQAIDEVVEELLSAYDKHTPIAVVYKATWEDEKIIRGTLEDIGKKVKAAGINRFAQILVGHFMASHYELSKLYDENFTHGYRTGNSKKKGD